MTTVTKLIDDFKKVRSNVLEIENTAAEIQREKVINVKK
jgi:hypothetical protein